MDMRDPGPGHALDSRPVLGLSEMRAAFLVDVSSAQSRETEGSRARLVMWSDHPMTEFDLQEDLDEEDDEDDEDQDDEDGDDEDEDDEDEDEEDVETWQVQGDLTPVVLHAPRHIA